MTAEKDEGVAFEEVGDMPVAGRDDLRKEAMIEKAVEKAERRQIDTAIKGETGEKPKGGGITKDVPKLLFRIGAKFISCPRFNIDEAEAEILTRHLNILIPVEGKAASVVVILMVIANKVYECSDAIMAKLSPPRGDVPEPLKDKDGKELPEQLK